MSICFFHHCAKCCENTEMALSVEDIIRIENFNNLGLKRADFCSIIDGMYILKNIHNHCIFLAENTNMCTIYDIRPTGCRFYPMVFNEMESRCIRDVDCPYRNEFYPISLDFKNTCRKLKKWVYRELLFKDA